MLHLLGRKGGAMSPTDLCWLPATEMAAAIRARQLSPLELIDALMSRIHHLNPALNAYCTLTEEAARQAARAAEAAVLRGDELGCLHGVPVSIKDLLFTSGVRTMRGSRIYEHFVPDQDAPSVAKLKASGAIVLGKTTTPEFGWKGATDSPVTGVSRNPWNRTRSCGGSSGGAAAAVAASIGPLAVGTDGAGSIRIPACFCGIVGLKPSRGRVAVYPPSAVGFLSHAGPMARTVRDAALMLQAMAGPDERDLGSLPADATAYLLECEKAVRGLRVAWSVDLGYAPVEPEIARICASAAQVFASDLGCVVEEAAPGFRDPVQSLQILWASGLAAALGPYLPQWGDQMDPGLVELIRSAEALSASDYAAAVMERDALWDHVQHFFARYDLLLTPTMPTTAFAAGVAIPTVVAGRPTTGFGYTPFTFPFNMTGQPAITVPCGVAADGMPVGLHIVGRRFADTTVLQAAAAFETARPWADRMPSFA
jgi:aspartyl-tRNA(Asn)/glutamyl-tRNA(Gln) amidotransferase subunit A